VTGMIIYAGGGPLFGKFVELLHELVPSLRKFGVFGATHLPPIWKSRWLRRRTNFAGRRKYSTSKCSSGRPGKRPSGCARRRCGCSGRRAIRHGRCDPRPAGDCAEDHSIRRAEASADDDQGGPSSPPAGPSSRTPWASTNSLPAQPTSLTES
jgi:hypothetical protein